MGASQTKVALQDSVANLLSRPIPATDPFWEVLLTSEGLSAEDLFAALNPSDVRQLVTTQPLNLRVLLEMSTGYCRNYEAAFDASHQPVDESGSGTISQQLGPVINCLHILSRLLPFTLEPQADAAAEASIESLFWGAIAAGGGGTYDCLSLAKKIVHVCSALLFKVGFSLQPSPSATVSSIIHADGLAEILPVPTAAVVSDANCTVALRCLLTCFSETLYMDTDAAAASTAPPAGGGSSQPGQSSSSSSPPSSVSRHHPEANRWLQWARSPSNPMARPLFAALLNIILGPESDPVGWAIPYAHLLSGAASAAWGGLGGGGSTADDRERLVGVSLHILLLLLDHSPTQRGGSGTAGAVSASSGGISNGTENVVWAELRDLPDRPASSREDGEGGAYQGNYVKILRGLERYLGQPALSERMMLPGSMKPVNCSEETLILLWHFLEGNVGFRRFVCKRAGPIVVAVSSFIVRYRREESKIGMMHVCVFILLLMSGERDFSVGLNRVIAATGPPPPAELGLSVGVSTHADLVLRGLLMMIHDGHSLHAAASQAEVALTVVCNISPYIKATSQAAMLSLLSLFDKLARPVAKAAGKISATSANTEYVVENKLLLLLETLANILQYQSEGNARLTYGLVRRQTFLHSLLVGRKSPNSPHVEVAAWQKPLLEKLGTLLQLVDGLCPLVEGFCAECEALEEAASEEQIVQFLEHQTLVGLLPVPHPILCRKYQPNAHTGLWFTTFLWGVIYLQHMAPPLFDSSAIKLFRVAYTGDADR